MMNKSYPILYSFRRCPYAMRARMALYKAGIVVELREVDLKNKPQEMLDISPKGTVPVLLLADGTVIEESMDIMVWALKENDPDNWLGGDRETSELLLHRNDNEFKTALYRLKYPDRCPDEDCSSAKFICGEILKDLNRHLNTHKHLSAEHMTITDAALFPFIRQCAATDKDWFDNQPCPHLQTWLKNLLNSALFEAIMPKFEVWTPKRDPVFFGPHF